MLPPPLQTTTGAWIMLQLTSYVQSVRGIGGRNSMAKKVHNFFPFQKKKFWKHVDSSTFLKRNFYLSLKISMVTTWLATEIRIPTKQEYFSGVLLAKSREITKLSPEIYPTREPSISKITNSRNWLIVWNKASSLIFDQTCQCIIVVQFPFCLQRLHDSREISLQIPTRFSRLLAWSLTSSYFWLVFRVDMNMKESFRTRNVRGPTAIVRGTRSNWLHVWLHAVHLINS